ncbi:MAG: tRNA (adenosine(37)-N6)-dimethylallyltransferase MiaA [Candidatus Omnitrophica bacterium]|nr:tRNA (adenosine(37)-N6)-dimethylallyltransferase MiaA [Candidatus Omnitrophota bacterium]
MNKAIFIVGPTAIGKTEVAFFLALKIGAEIVSADSMLVYKEPNIITSKPPSWMRKIIKHYFIDIISVTENYNVFKYYIEAQELIKNLIFKKPIIVCGGSCLYIKALLDGIFKEPSCNISIRKQLEEEAKEYGKEYLKAKLQKVDPATADKVFDLRRIIRALEVYYLTGIPLSEKKKEAKGLWGELPIKIYGLNTERKLLYDKINKRVERMFEEGLVDEVKNLLKLNLSLTAKKLIGINEVKGFLEEKYDLEYAKELIKKNTRHFAKRQLTWFKKEKRINWIDVGNLKSSDIVDLILKNLNKNVSN